VVRLILSSIAVLVVVVTHNFPLISAASILASS
jgi:hypothetical protein